MVVTLILKLTTQLNSLLIEQIVLNYLLLISTVMPMLHWTMLLLPNLHFQLRLLIPIFLYSLYKENVLLVMLVTNSMSIAFVINWLSMDVMLIPLSNKLRIVSLLMEVPSYLLILQVWNILLISINTESMVAINAKLEWPCLVTIKLMLLLIDKISQQQLWSIMLGPVLLLVLFNILIKQLLGILKTIKTHIYIIITICVTNMQ